MPQWSSVPSMTAADALPAADITGCGERMQRAARRAHALTGTLHPTPFNVNLHAWMCARHRSKYSPAGSACASCRRPAACAAAAAKSRCIVPARGQQITAMEQRCTVGRHCDATRTDTSHSPAMLLLPATLLHAAARQNTVATCCIAAVWRTRPRRAILFAQGGPNARALIGNAAYHMLVKRVRCIWVVVAPCAATRLRQASRF
jgi:hypothetical protein